MLKLIDKYNREHNYLRVSVTDKCNFKCFYCNPVPITRHRDEILSFEEIERIVRIFSFLGINKVRLTGGEPLLRNNIEELIRSLASIQGVETIGITTNGYLLKDKVERLINSGINKLNISLDTLKPSKFKYITKVNGFSRTLDSIEEALLADFEKIKINVIVIKGFNDDEIVDFIDYFKDQDIIIRFIEYMPFRNNNWESSQFISSNKIKEIIEEKYSLIPILSNGDTVSEDFMTSDYRVKVGFISSNSKPFCGGCSRLRLTSDGKLKLCLYDERNFDLKSLLRGGASDEELKKVIIKILYHKRFEKPSFQTLTKHNVPIMSQIGG